MLMLLLERLQQTTEPVVIEFMHQLQQATNLPLGKSFACKPSQVVTWQITDQLVFVLTKRYTYRHQPFQVLRLHHDSN